MSESDATEEDEVKQNDECMNCGKETSSMEYCYNAGCDMYLCNMCYITTSSGEIICDNCADNCFCCDEIINLSDIEMNTDIECNICSVEVTYCEKCTEQFHLFNCNLGVCHSCIEKCLGCKKVLCCNRPFHTTGMCEMCVLFQFREAKEYMIKDILIDYFCKDLCNIIHSYTE